MSIRVGNKKFYAPDEKNPIFSGGYIYLIEHNNIFKIGKSKNVNKRIKGLTLSGIKIIHTKFYHNYHHIEKELHTIMKRKSIGSEWFELSNEDIEFIKNYKC